MKTTLNLQPAPVKSCSRCASGKGLFAASDDAARFDTELTHAAARRVKDQDSRKIDSEGSAGGGDANSANAKPAAQDDDSKSVEDPKRTGKAKTAKPSVNSRKSEKNAEDAAAASEADEAETPTQTDPAAAPGLALPDPAAADEPPVQVEDAEAVAADDTDPQASLDPNLTATAQAAFETAPGNTAVEGEAPDLSAEASPAAGAVSTRTEAAFHRAAAHPRHVDALAAETPDAGDAQAIKPRATTEGAAPIELTDAWDFAQAAPPEAPAPESSPAVPHDVLPELQADVPSPAAANASPTTAPHATGPAPAAAPPAESRFAEQNHATIVKAIHGELLPEGGTLRIRLDPPELGSMQVTVHLRDGQMAASFETSNDQATSVLSHSLSQLKSALESQGVQVDKLHVQQAPREQAFNSHDGRGQENPSQDGSARQEQQRKEMLRRMWRKLGVNYDPLDMVA